jgi:hypothetical protein
MISGMNRGAAFESRTASINGMDFTDTKKEAGTPIPRYCGNMQAEPLRSQYRWTSCGDSGCEYQETDAVLKKKNK